ncbi:hypothetical protein ACI2IX_06800 [Leifsonia aquatica]|uniref:hypothetical protein n=1 Tax=Leifsonia aquatica TaxID=144185 RepID=UPI00384ADFB0
MSTLPPPPSPDSPSRRPFAAKYAHRGWGIGLIVFGVLAFFGGFSVIGSGTNPIPSFVVGLGAAAVGVYLFRGRGVNPAVSARNAAAEYRTAARVLVALDEAKAALAAAPAGGATVVAYRNLEATARRLQPAEAPALIAAAVSEACVDPAALESPWLGAVAAVGGGQVEFFADWVIYGQEAHDVDASTRGQVFVDGSVQVTSAVVTDKKGAPTIVNQQHDLRTAQLQLTSATWSMSVAIDQSQVQDARRLVDQLAARVQSAKEAASTGEIRDLVDTILMSTGQPPAEKLRELSNLRYERLLSDEEFESAKSRILGLR